MRLNDIFRYAMLLAGLRPDPALGFNLVTRLARRVVPGYRFTWPQLEWFGASRLNQVLDRFGEQHGFNAHRRLAIEQLMRLTSGVLGDTAECGVYKGCGSYLILKMNQGASTTRMHHIFDSFEGLSEPKAEDGKDWSANALAIDDQVVRQNLREFSEFRTYKGWIPARFAEVADRTFSFVHIDVDLYDPTRHSIEFFYPRLNHGAILICDDYGFLTCPGATGAVDEFLLDKPEKMVLLSGGGGFFVKGCLTGKETR